MMCNDPKEERNVDSSLSRRGFVAAAVSAASSARVLGANDRIRLGMIGNGGRGNHLMNMANAASGIEWVAFCDAWDERRNKIAQRAGGNVQTYGDYRKLLDRKDIDAVIVATWDNLHCPIGSDVCRAGKDVFVEKPMSSTPMQGHELIRAARENKRVVQVGTQQRSIAHFIEAKQRFFDSGLIGKVNMVRTLWNANSGYLTKPPAGMEKKPEGLDWDACLGWLPKIPWDPKRYFNRFAYWDLSTGGQTGGLFVHMVDVVHWFMNLKKPISAVALGGIYLYDDGRDTPDNVNAILDYPENLNVTFEATLTDMIPQGSADIVFMGTGGRLSIFRGGYRFLPSKENAHLGEIKAQGAPEEAHMANFLDCVRSRKATTCGAVDGHYSSLACHLLNLAYQKKARVLWQKEWDA
jgi:predicted dehydrogenase